MTEGIVLDPREWGSAQWRDFGESLTQTTGILLTGVALGGTIALKLAFQRTCTRNVIDPCNQEFQTISSTFVEPVAVIGALVLLGSIALAVKEDDE